jgi:hypothetical protein
MFVIIRPQYGSAKQAANDGRGKYLPQAELFSTSEKL